MMASPPDIMEAVKGYLTPGLLVWIATLLLQIRDAQRKQGQQLQSDDGKEGLIPRMREMDGWHKEFAPEWRSFCDWRDETEKWIAAVDARHQQEDEIDRRAHPRQERSR
jgi:hypothetical protein